MRSERISHNAVKVGNDIGFGDFVSSADSEMFDFVFLQKLVSRLGADVAEHFAHLRNIDDIRIILKHNLKKFRRLHGPILLSKMNICM